MQSTPLPTCHELAMLEKPQQPCAKRMKRAPFRGPHADAVMHKRCRDLPLYTGRRGWHGQNGAAHDTISDSVIESAHITRNTTLRAAPRAEHAHSRHDPVFSSNGPLPSAHHGTASSGCLPTVHLLEASKPPYTPEGRATTFRTRQVVIRVGKRASSHAVRKYTLMYSAPRAETRLAVLQSPYAHVAALCTADAPFAQAASTLMLLPGLTGLRELVVHVAGGCVQGGKASVLDRPCSASEHSSSIVAPSNFEMQRAIRACTTLLNPWPASPLWMEAVKAVHT